MQEKSSVNKGSYIRKLNKIVIHNINKDKLLVSELINRPEEILTRGKGVSDKVAGFFGSWKFIICFYVALFSAALVNIRVIINAFDLYPIVLLNLAIFCIIALQIPIVLMSQNRLEEKDRKRNENDYLINLKTEMQIRSLHQKLDCLLDSQAKHSEVLHKVQSKSTKSWKL
jgi:uncharacterized membrane protein